MAEQDIPHEATTDPKVEEKARLLEDALATIPSERWEKAGVIIEGLTGPPECPDG